MLCEQCKQDLDLTNFYRSRDSYRQPCKQCRAENAKIKYANITEKKCGRCGIIKPVSEFDLSRDYGYQSFCKECKKERYRLQPDFKPQQTGTKVCSCCGQEKEIGAFSISKKNEDGRSSRCRDCVSKYDASRTFPIQMEGTKYCPRCKQELPITDFGIARGNPTGRTYSCRACNAKFQQEIIDKVCIYCNKPFKGKREIDFACPSCKFHSQPEHNFIKILNECSIKFLNEFRVNNCWYDFYLSEYNLLIDISPTASHSSYTTIPHFTAKDKDYHYDRLVTATNAGYNYINIWSWLDEKAIVQAIKKNKLQIIKGNIQKHWGKDKTSEHVFDAGFDEQQMIAEGWRPLYDDGQTLIY